MAIKLKGFRRNLGRRRAAVDAAAKKAVDNLVLSNEQFASSAARTGERLRARARETQAKPSSK